MQKRMVFALIALFVLLAALVLPGLAPASYAQNTPCYRAQGGGTMGLWQWRHNGLPDWVNDLH